jgi:hypothetical protein
MTNPKHPIQPLIKDDKGILRFKHNAIVRSLLDDGPYDMNNLSVMTFSSEDREQFAQLIGYSLSGFFELDYVTDSTYLTAAKMAESNSDEKDARIKYLEETLAAVKAGLKDIIPELFRIHPDDLKD